MNTYEVTVVVGTVVAASESEALKEAESLLNELAESNDGSEVLANATPQLKRL